MTGCRPGAIARPAATLLFAAAVASCTDTVLTPPDESPITIAGTRAATGPLSTEGRNMERGFRLAVEMLNDVGGIARGGHGLAVGDRRNPGGRVAGPPLLDVHRDGAGAVRRGASPDAGSQRRLVRLQLQWQEDGRDGLVQRVIHPASAADAEPCLR